MGHEGERWFLSVFSQEFTQALPPPHGWMCDLQGECLRQRDGWNDLSTFPRNSRGRVSSPRQGLWPPTPHVVSALPRRVRDPPEKVMSMTVLWPPAPVRVGEFGRETLEEVSVGIEPAPSTPCLACNDLSGNRSTSQVDELAAKHPAAGCSRPD